MTNQKAKNISRWYPYLEGYSPEFVKTVLRCFSPKAKAVLDPFGGTATTAFVAGEQRLKAYFCEVNPVMQFIFEVKAKVRLMDSKSRQDLSNRLIKLNTDIPRRLDGLPPDKNLLSRYERTFGASSFFDEMVLDQVLKARTFIDELDSSDLIVAQLLTVAVLSSLIPCSRLQRAGDLRYKNGKELNKGIPPFLNTVTTKFSEIIEDIRSENGGLLAKPFLICEDAKNLSLVPFLGVDTVITSPPYVNGTNYFRNTKVELWFLGCLGSKDDLRYYRSKAITAGINGVTVSKSSPPLPVIEAIVQKLQENAYDQRIPRMVASYFTELSEVFSGVQRHLVKNAIVAIDIGDSNYGGVHVPVDRLLVKCLSPFGFSLEKEVELRQRRSKNGACLKQVLLVFKYKKAPVLNGKSIEKVATNWKGSWQNFKVMLPHQEKPYSKRNWGNSLHSLCSYQGKMKPAIAHHLVKIFVPEGGIMLDPFAGVGTIPFEAALQGKKAYSLDLSLPAYIISRAKLTIINAHNAYQVIDELKRFIECYNPTNEEFEEAETFGFNGKLVEYYHPQTLREILAARRFFLSRREADASTMLVYASCLHILHGNRPYALSRRSHPIIPYSPSGEFEYRSLIKRLKEKVKRSLSANLPADFVEGSVYWQDTTSWWPLETDNLDAVITSPPFFDSTRFYLANWLRMWFVGWSSSDFKGKSRLFVDERQKVGFEVYEPIIRQARERLKLGGVLVLHLGKSKKCDMALELARIGKKWFAHFDTFDESVAHCESHGIRDKGTVTEHQYLIFY